MTRKDFVEILTDAVVIWLPIDLLYLYFAGSWYEPIKVILYSELVLLFALPIFGVLRVYFYIRCIKRIRDDT